MPLPETSLHPGGFGSLGCDQGVLVGGYQRPFAKDDAQVLSELGFNLLEFRVVRAARRTLKVCKLFQGHRGRWVAADVRRFRSRRFRSRGFRSLTAGEGIPVWVCVRVRRLS